MKLQMKVPLLVVTILIIIGNGIAFALRKMVCYFTSLSWLINRVHVVEGVKSVYPNFRFVENFFGELLSLEREYRLSVG